MLQATSLYTDCAQVFREHIPYTWISLDDLLVKLENRGVFNVPGFCECASLRKVLIYQSCWADQGCVELRPLMTAYGPTTAIRRVV